MVFDHSMEDAAAQIVHQRHQQHSLSAVLAAQSFVIASATVVPHAVTSPPSQMTDLLELLLTMVRETYWLWKAGDVGQKIAFWLWDNICAIWSHLF